MCRETGVVVSRAIIISLWSSKLNWKLSQVHNMPLTLAMHLNSVLMHPQCDTYLFSHIVVQALGLF